MMTSEEGSWNHRVDAPDVLLMVNRPIVQKFLNHDEVTGFLAELIIHQRLVCVVLHGGERLIDLGDLLQNALLFNDEILLGHLTVTVEVQSFEPVEGYFVRTLSDLQDFRFGIRAARLIQNSWRSLPYAGGSNAFLLYELRIAGCQQQT